MNSTELPDVVMELVIDRKFLQELPDLLDERRAALGQEGKQQLKVLLVGRDEILGVASFVVGSVGQEKDLRTHAMVLHVAFVVLIWVDKAILELEVKLVELESE